MSADKGSQDTDVSGNEAVETAARRGKKNEINKGINVSTYGDRNMGEQSFVNFKPEPNKFTPVSMQVAGKVLDGLTGATKKNRQFLIDNYDRIGTNYKLPDRATFNKMSLEEKNKTYSTMRKDFMSNNKNPFGERTRDGGDGNNSVKTVKQIEEESKKEMKTSKTTEEEEAAYKKRKGLVGSRSLFSTGGQRGFFN